MRCEEIMRSESRIFSTCSSFLTIRGLADWESGINPRLKNIKYDINDNGKIPKITLRSLQSDWSVCIRFRRNTSLFHLEALLIVGVGLWLSNCQHEVVRWAFCCLTVNSCVVANERKHTC